jgi:Transposase DDE domain
VSDTFELDQVHLITNGETTPSITTDVDTAAAIHFSLAVKDMPPGDHLIDSEHVDVEWMVSSQFERGVRIVGRGDPNVSWQAQANEGFDISHFVSDWEARRATCPDGKTIVLWKPGKDRWGSEVIHTELALRECLPCRSRPLCTQATTEGREMTLRPREQHEALQEALQQEKTEEWKAANAVRAGGKETFSQGIRGFGLRNCRYIGLAKTRLQHVATAAAINVHRISDRVSGVPCAATRTPAFARLVA